MRSNQAKQKYEAVNVIKYMDCCGGAGECKENFDVIIEL